MLMGIAAALASNRFDALKPRIAEWIITHIYHTDVETFLAEVRK